MNKELRDKLYELTRILEYKLIYIPDCETILLVTDSINGGLIKLFEELIKNYGAFVSCGLNRLYPNKITVTIV